MENSLIIFGAKYLIFFVILIALGYIFSKPKEIRNGMLIFAIIVLPLSYLAAKIASYFYYDARPLVTQNFTPLVSHVADNGFPSDHALLATAAAAIVFFFDRKVGAFLFLLAILVGASRVLAGVHHTVDILGSIIIVALISFLVYQFLPVKKL